MMINTVVVMRKDVLHLFAFRNAFYGHLSRVIVMMVASFEKRKVHLMDICLEDGSEERIMSLE